MKKRRVSGVRPERTMQAMALIEVLKTVEEKFTRQEYSVLSMLLQKKSKLCTRDDIGDILWGNDSYEKYSDWAIDQLMSKLRKKLTDLGVKEKLVTVRGKGYKLLSPATNK